MYLEVRQQEYKISSHETRDGCHVMNWVGIAKKLLFLFMTVLPQAFFPLVGCHFMAFSFLSAWHFAWD